MDTKSSGITSRLVPEDRGFHSRLHPIQKMPQMMLFTVVVVMATMVEVDTEDYAKDILMLRMLQVSMGKSIALKLSIIRGGVGLTDSLGVLSASGHF